MEAQLILAEAAAHHSDGTLSMLRAGITHLWSEASPWNLHGSLVMRILADLGDRGKHEFDLQCLDEDGRTGAPPLKGQFEVPAGGGTTATVLGVQLKFEHAGKYTFYLRIDNVQRAELSLTCAQRSRAPGPGVQ